MNSNDGLTDAERQVPSVDLRQAVRQTSLTAQYPFVGLGQVQGLMYVGLGLAGEAGEVANQVKKIARDDGGFVTDARRDKITSELGDVIWYWLRACEELGLDPNAVIRANLAKLRGRYTNGTIRGDGEHRVPSAHLNGGPYAGKEVNPDGTLRDFTRCEDTPTLSTAAGTVVPDSFGASDE